MPEALGSAGGPVRTGLGRVGLLPPVEVYPERTDPPAHWLDPVEAALGLVAGACVAPVRRLRLIRMVWATEWWSRRFRRMSAETLARTTLRLRRDLRRHGPVDRLRPRAFALIREHSDRVLGLRHHRVQILGGLAILDGAVAEMETGEGKSVTAALAAGVAAMAGTPVHIVTVNNYLAERDAEALGPLFAKLGLTVGCIRAGSDAGDRRRAYARDVVYASNKEIAFDYLRDRVRLGGQPRNMQMKLNGFLRESNPDAGLVMRGLPFAIVDEADSVLVDEARTPLILSRETDRAEESAWAGAAHEMAAELVRGTDYRILPEERRIDMTHAGRARLARLGERRGGIWLNRIRRDHAVRQALSALLLFKRGDHYLVRDGKVLIVDEYTGRVMEERSWSDGLHQLVEVKEGVPVTSRKEAIARMTYQRFFRRYRRLAGMTGTAREVAVELFAVYRLPVFRVPTNAPSRRTRLDPHICETQAQKWQVVTARAMDLHAAGRPVLIGTRSVNASEAVSEHLSAAGLDHEVLNAKDDGREAEIIARAGQPGRITVATNMAGRGVDILLGEGVAEQGGLHVILTERHDSKRIDRQLEGRNARRGEAGSTETILSLEDPLLEIARAPLLRHLAARGGPLRARAAGWLFRAAQRRSERTHSRARRILLDQDRRLGTILAFSGKPE